MTNTRLLAVTMVLAAACGGTKASNSHPYTGTFSIQGAPHSGLYDECGTLAAVGNSTTVTCTGLPGCASCGVVVALPISGTGNCTDGSASVTITGDPGIPSVENSAAAGCDAPTAPVPGDPNPNCPNDSMGCNRVVGECTVNSNFVTPISDTNPDGHYSGTIDATVWSGTKSIGCGMTGSNMLAPDGTMYAITLTGAF
jgi:hypothetical protein